MRHLSCIVLLMASSACTSPDPIGAKPIRLTLPETGRRVPSQRASWPAMAGHDSDSSSEGWASAPAARTSASSWAPGLSSVGHVTVPPMVPSAAPLLVPLVVPFETPSFELSAYRKNYILVASHDSALRKQPSSAANGDNKAAEVKFQISLRYPFAQSDDQLQRGVLAYTATSHWQLYDFAGSAPFRTVDQEPELFVERDLPDEDRPIQWRFGLDHNSNGESGLSSRSWNRAFVEIVVFDPRGFLWTEEDSFRLQSEDEIDDDVEVVWKTSLRIWQKFFVDDDNNGDISRFFGHFEAHSDLYWTGEHQTHLSFMLRNNLRVNGDNRGANVLEYSWKVVAGVRGLVQYFNGYGESLLDYNRSANRIGIGFELSP